MEGDSAEYIDPVVGINFTGSRRARAVSLPGFSRPGSIDKNRSQSWMDRLKKGKHRGSAIPNPDWTKTGSFMNRPEQGWIHPDSQLATDAGICYGIRYIGCLEVKESMKNLDFETRTSLARETIHRVAEAAGLKIANKKRKFDKKIMKMLGESPNMRHAGSNVNLTITTDSLNLMVMESGEVIANHQMQGISFASGGDVDTLDFVAYVAKDNMNGRACHVFECGGGLAEDVITTVGQAFELRFKEFLKNQPKAITLPDRTENPVFNGEASAWGDEPDYYNDKPNMRPPSPHVLPPQYISPTSNLQVSDGIYSAMDDNDMYDNKENVGHLMDFSYPADGQSYNNPEAGASAAPTLPISSLSNPLNSSGRSYDNKSSTVDVLKSRELNAIGEDSCTSSGGSSSCRNTGSRLDPFDMEPFSSTLQNSNLETPAPPLRRTTPLPAPPSTASAPPPVSAKPSLSNGHAFADMSPSPPSSSIAPLTPSVSIQAMKPQLSHGPLNDELWYHGAISRKQAECLLKVDGDFLVRDSTNSPGQYVLSGRQTGSPRHLLLVDPEGVVRTKDHVFESVSHLICYHRDYKLPIVSQESELYLQIPIPKTKT